MPPHEVVRDALFVVVSLILGLTAVGIWIAEAIATKGGTP